MRKNISLILLIFLFYSCGIATRNFRDLNRRNIIRLSIGMEKTDVLKVMGNRQVRDLQLGTVTNPYKSEIFKAKEKTFEVWYYYTDRTVADGMMSDGELTPVVFENEKLVGWGTGFFQDLVKKYEIKVK